MKKTLLAATLSLACSAAMASLAASPITRLLPLLHNQGAKGLVLAIDDGSADASITTDLLYGGAVRHALAGYQIVVLDKAGPDWTAHSVQGCQGYAPCAADALRHLSAQQVQALRATPALKDARVLVYRGTGAAPVGVADAFDDQRSALLFAQALGRASAAQPATSYGLRDFSRR